MKGVSHTTPPSLFGGILDYVYALSERRPFQVPIHGGQSKTLAHGEFQVRGIVCREAMFATKSLRCVEDYRRRCSVVYIRRHTIQVLDESLHEFGRQPFSSFAHERRIENFMPPEGRNSYPITHRDQL